MQNQESILNEQTDFYTHVYKKTRKFAEALAAKFLIGTEVPQIKEDDKETLELDITGEELTNTPRTMKNNSAPGLGGITTSFLKMFWNKLKDLLIESLKAAREVGQNVTIAKKSNDHLDSQISQISHGMI